jgi:hypothetical protein
MLRDAAEKNTEPLETVNPLDFVHCLYCKKSLNRKDEDCVQVSNSRYAHKHCVELEAKRELTDSEKLDRYIMELFKVEYVPPRIRKQINNYIDEYNFSFSGIQKALIYFHEVKHNPVDISKGIGIVPYIYRDAYNYYYSIWLAQQKNQTKVLQDYVIETEEIHIANPKKRLNLIKRPLFTFLDEE